jgi:putative ABC transport system permease protein
MIFWTILKVALKSLLANKLRSMLAMLGIIIGVSAVISMLAIGAGTQKAVIDQFSAFGTNLLVVRPGQRGTGGVMSGTQQNLTLEDAEAILREVPQIKAVTPVVGGSAQVKYFAKNSRTNVQGVAVTYLSIRNYEVERGEAFTEMDVDRNARVALIGPVTADNLFGAQDPVGQTIKINGINFRVAGVLKGKGDQGFFNPDDQILIPYTTAMRQVFGSTTTNVNAVREINIQSADGADLDKLQADILALMRKRHRVQPGMPDDVNLRNQAEFLEARSRATATFTVLLGSTAGISLLVGGIGIMNIMLVTVTERTREIGIRKAIGAKDRDILRQFLIEALLMSGLGGLIGVGLGVGTSELVGRFTDFATIVQPFSVALSLGVSAAVGVFFGYYPATRAAKLDPIEALRYE